MDLTEDLSARVLLRNILSTEQPRTPIARSTRAQSTGATRRSDRLSKKDAGPQTPQDILRRSLRHKIRESITRQSLPATTMRTASVLLRRTNTPAATSVLFDDGETPRHILMNILRTEPVKTPVVHEKAASEEPQPSSANSSITSKRTSIELSGLDLPDITMGNIASTAKGLSRKRPRRSLNVTAFEKRLKVGEDVEEENGDSIDDASSLSLSSSTSLSLKTPFVDVRTEKKGLQRRVSNRRKITEEEFGAAVNKRQMGGASSFVQVERGLSETACSEGFNLSLSKLSEPDITNDILHCNTALYAQPNAMTSTFSILATQDKPTVLASQLQRQMEQDDEMEAEQSKLGRDKSTYAFPTEEEAEPQDEEGFSQSQDDANAAESQKEDEKSPAHGQLGDAAAKSEEEDGVAESQTSVRDNKAKSEEEENRGEAQTEEEVGADSHTQDDAATRSQSEEEEAAADSQTEEEGAGDSQTEEEQGAVYSQPDEDVAAGSQFEEEELVSDSQTEEEEGQGTADLQSEEEEVVPDSQTEKEEGHGTVDLQSEEEEVVPDSQTEKEQEGHGTVDLQSEEEEVAQNSQIKEEEQEGHGTVDLQTEEEEVAPDSQTEEEEEQEGHGTVDLQSEEEDVAPDSQIEEEEEEEGQGTADLQSEEEEVVPDSQTEEEEEGQGTADLQSEEEEVAPDSQTEEEEEQEGHGTVELQSEEDPEARSQSEEEEDVAEYQSDQEDPAANSQSDGEADLADSQPEDEANGELEEEDGDQASEQLERDTEHVSRRTLRSEGGLIVPLTEAGGDVADAAEAAWSDGKSKAHSSLEMGSHESSQLHTGIPDLAESSPAGQTDVLYTEFEPDADKENSFNPLEAMHDINDSKHLSDDSPEEAAAQDLAEQEEECEDEEDDEESDEIHSKTPEFVRQKINFSHLDRQASPSVFKNIQASGSPGEGVPASKPKRVRQKRKGPSRNDAELPKSYLMGVFKHFAKTKVSADVYPVLREIMDKYFDRLAEDLETYAVHAKRKTIEVEDAVLLLKRQGYVNDKVPVEVLIEKYLRMDQRKLLIPIATSGNVVIPKAKR